jgi:predicted porin
MRKLLACAALVSLAALAGCRKANPNTEIEAAIQKHLNQNSHLMLSSFTTHFETVTVHGDTAQALVKYESKNIPNLAVEVSYGLKQAGGQWQVVSSSSAGGQTTNPANPHASTTLDQAPPPQAPPGPMPSH